MNYYIYFSRVLRYLASWIQERAIDHTNMDTIRGSILRFVVYSVLYRFSRKIKRIGEDKYLNVSSPGTMEWEINEYMFRKLVLYVEGYLATISYRMTDAPKTMPPDRETRAKWGRAALEHMATRSESRHVPDEISSRRKERLKDWAEIGRIYDWYTKERETWNDPYEGKIEIDFGGDGMPSLDEESEEYSRKSRRYRSIRHERREGRVRRLFERRNILTYD